MKKKSVVRCSAVEDAEDFVNDVLKKEEIEIHYLDDNDEERIETHRGDETWFFQEPDTGATVIGCDETTWMFPYGQFLFVKKVGVRKEKKARKKRQTRRV